MMDTRTAEEYMKQLNERAATPQQEDGHFLMSDTVMKQKSYFLRELYDFLGPVNYVFATEKISKKEKKIPIFQNITSRLSSQDQEIYLQYYLNHAIQQPRHVMELRPIVLAEQKAYVQFCKEEAKKNPLQYNVMDEEAKAYIEGVLKKRISKVKNIYPESYTRILELALSHPSDHHPVHLLPIKEILSLGSVPPFDATFMNKSKIVLPMNTDVLNKHYTVPDSKTMGYLHNTPVSKDRNCIKLANEVGADVVASSSALQALINCHPNHPQSNATPRDIPILITSAAGDEKRRIVYLDSPLPPQHMSIHEKKMWHCKRASRVLFCQRGEKFFNFANGNETLNSKKQNPKKPNKPLTFQEELLKYKEQSRSELNVVVSTTPGGESGESSQGHQQPAPHHNFVYGQWCLKYQEPEKLSAKNKRGSAEINLVIRTSYHGYEMSDGCSALSRISVKLEYQPMFGAQTCTVGELSDEWMTIQLRPNSILYRVRVNADTLEVIQVQKLTMQSIMMEARKQELNTTHCIGALHHILRELVSLQPGNYLLRLHPREGQAELMISSDKLKPLGKKILNLNDLYGVENPQNFDFLCPYSPIDSDVITPWQQFKKRVPATFPPVFKVNKQCKKRIRPQKHSSIASPKKESIKKKSKSDDN